jgi:hypothetical protein
MAVVDRTLQGARFHPRVSAVFGEIRDLGEKYLDSNLAERGSEFDF